MSANAPTVSVIIPTFNRSDVVTTAVDSVLAQTYSDYELIIIDDGSTDDTADRIRQYNGRVRYFCQENRGASAAQNKGIELAKGTWISILASDDFWLPTKLEVQLSAINAMGQGYGACFTDCSFFGDVHTQGTAFEQAQFRPARETGPVAKALPLVLGRYPAIYVQSLLMLRCLVEELHGFDPEQVVAEDTDLIFRMSFKTRFCYVNQPVVKINRSPSREGLMDLFSTRNEKTYRSLERMFQKWSTLANEVDADVANYIHDGLRGVYYDWLVAKVYSFSYLDFYSIVGRLRQLGETNWTILSTLAFRARRKMRTILKRMIRL